MCLFTASSTLGASVTSLKTDSLFVVRQLQAQQTRSYLHAATAIELLVYYKQASVKRNVTHQFVEPPTILQQVLNLSIKTATASTCVRLQQCQATGFVIACSARRTIRAPSNCRLNTAHLRYLSFEDLLH